MTQRKTALRQKLQRLQPGQVLRPDSISNNKPPTHWLNGTNFQLGLYQKGEKNPTRKLMARWRNLGNARFSIIIGVEFFMFENIDGIYEKGSREELLLRQIDPHRLPRHIAIIMDGNGRWAKRRGKSRVAGHRAGARSARLAVETCARLGVETLTLYAFSTENWRRPAQEVQALMQLLKEFINRELSTLKENNIRLSTIGRLEELEPAVRKKVLYAIEETKGGAGMLLNVALNYSGRTELVDAFRSLYREAVRREMSPEEINEALIRGHLYTANLPDPDLLIRTSGEMRISNFLLWQIAYSELYVTEVLWPDFSSADLFSAIIAYQHRDRRYGGVPPDVPVVTAKVT